MTLGPGTIVQNRYRIVKLLGLGGFGAMYRAWDTTLDRPCALKENLDASPEGQRQFLREAKILANLNHPNLPRVTDYFSVKGQGEYLVMDFVDGQDLQEMLENNSAPLQEARVLGWIGQVCDALAYLHSHSPPVIHRDIKPANIKITSSGQAMLVDFGIAKVYDPGLKTTVGAQAVTPGFSPQEQYGKGTTDGRSDIYSLGATLYTLLTAHEPPESIQRNLGTTLVPPRTLNQAVSASTERAILKAMEMLPGARFQRAAEFKAALLPPPPSPRPAPVPVARPAPAPQVPAIRSYQAPHAASSSGIPMIWLGLIGFLLLALVILLGTLIRRLGNSGRTGRLATQPVLVVRSATSIIPTAASTMTNTLEATSLPVVKALASPNPVLPVATRVSGLDGMVMDYVPAGSFAMGSTDSDSQAGDDEKPSHRVYLDAFWIDQTEVTNGMFATCVQAGACQPPGEKGSKTRLLYYSDSHYENYPVIYVSYSGAEDYCRWAGRRLPTEAEWEKAARGIDGRIYPWGNQLPDASLLNYNNQVGDTQPVGSYPAGSSPFGALDMAGNVAEWTADWYGESYYGTSPAYNPKGPPSGEYRVLRGGSWFNVGRVVRAAFRMWNYPDLQSDSSSFRCARSA